jgi:hypothetical protein
MTFHDYCDGPLSEDEGLVEPSKSESNDFEANGNKPILPTNTTASQPFYPYPNHSSFELGDWYWRCGPINSMEGFQELCAIILHSDFVSQDIAATHWAMVHWLLPTSGCLGLGPSEKVQVPEEGGKWVNNLGPNWKSAKIWLNVPFST